MGIMEERRSYIGGSDAPAILGVSRYKHALQVYAEKVGESKGVPDNEWMYWGRKLEPVVADAYAEKTNREVVNPEGATAFHPDFPWMGGKFDRRIIDKARGDGILEIKTSGSWHRLDWEEEPPLEPMVQLQHYLAVSGLKWGSIAVLIGGQTFKWFDIERNDRFVQSMIEKERTFWEEHVEKRIPPDPDGSSMSSAAIKALYPEDTGEEVILPDAAMEWTGEIRTLGAEIDRLSSKKRELENRIKLAMKESTYGLLQDGSKWTHKLVHRDAHEVKATSFRKLSAPR